MSLPEKQNFARDAFPPRLLMTQKKKKVVPPRYTDNTLTLYDHRELLPPRLIVGPYNQKKTPLYTNRYNPPEISSLRPVTKPQPMTLALLQLHIDRIESSV
jgi:hypothetical protein